MVSLLRKLLRICPDKIYLQLVFFKHFRRFIDFKTPKTFNEKLQWLKLYDRKPEYTTMVDKFLVKDYVAAKIGTEFVVPTLGVWNHPEEIDFSKLPNQFVLKWNHDSGSVVVCKDKSQFDVQDALKKLKRGDGRNGYWYGREWPYKNVEPKIIAEKYLADDASSDSLTDYKFHCFNGCVKLILVCCNRFSKSGMEEAFFDENWHLLNLRRPKTKKIEKIINPPHELKKMKQLAEILSKNIPFSRIDFYDVCGKIYFGEITFYSASGFLPFDPDEWDEKLGDLLEIN